jgi:1,4-alpha-glucan branching enzyme
MIQVVRFTFNTGIRQSVFSNVRLSGSWDATRMDSANWSTANMAAITGADGCPAFQASVNLDSSQIGTNFNWGVTLDGPGGPNVWGIPLEVSDANSVQRYRTFQLAGGAGIQDVDYYLTTTRYLGARKVYAAPGAAPGIAFTVWAPNAQAIDVVFGLAANGYIDNTGGGIDPAAPVIALAKDAATGIWSNDPTAYAFSALLDKPYMYRLTDEQGNTQYRTDIHSLQQLGQGGTDPSGAAYAGDPSGLDGTVSCTVVTDPDVVYVSTGGAPPAPVADTDFWTNEFTLTSPVPTQLENLVIYELHIGSLGYGNPNPGDLNDAIAFIPHLKLLGVNAVELLPMSQYDGTVAWGYGDTHHFAIQSAAGGRDEYRQFVKACHQSGIAVIQDVVYNHFDQQADRAEWYFDSSEDDHNIYYWYEGAPADYPNPDGGYLNNGSSGYTPGFRDENVRSMFISSAAAFVMDFHVDGFRVDLTDAIHADNTVNANGDSDGNANQFGCKFLREWSRTLRLLKPTVMLAAEDYTGWAAMTQLPDNGGMGFDSVWYADFIHHLVGDGDNYGSSYARLIHTAGLGGDGALAMDYFGGALQATGNNCIVYHEVHDEVGNEAGTRRTIVEAVNGAAIIGATRQYAEARCRFAAGMNILSAGTPMFFMAEETGAQNLFPLDDVAFLAAREDIVGDTTGVGANLFRFYQDVIKFRLAHPSVQTHTLTLVYVNDANRIIAFLRTEPTEQLLIVGSLSNTPFSSGYLIQAIAGTLPDGNWREIFNSDAAIYGGNNVGNYGAAIPSSGGQIQMIIPANGVLILSLS